MEQTTKKMCKNHPGKEAIMRSDGVSPTGLCAECLTARAKKGGRKKKANR